MRNRSEDAVSFARNLRQNMSESEKALWAELRRKKHRFRFRKQHPIGPYVLDFYCPEVLVCVEVDGEQHAERVERDEARDEWLLREGILTIRIPSWDVFDDLDSVVETVIATCFKRQQEPPPAQGCRLELPPPASQGADFRRASTARCELAEYLQRKRLAPDCLPLTKQGEGR